MRYAQLKAFHAVARWGGFSVAAKKINLTQPAVSDHVRNLEETYGTQLFVRGRRSTMLTDVGRKLFVLTEQLIETEAKARELLSRARGLTAGQLNIGADAAVHILPLLSRFREKYPQIALSITTGNSRQLKEKLENLEIDFAVVANEPVSQSFVTRLLNKDGFAAFSARGHAFGKRKTTTLKTLVSSPLVLREAGSATRHLFEQACRERGLRFENVIEVEGREAARDAVAAGLGIGVISKAEFVDDKRLAMIEISDWHEEMSEWLVCLETRASLHMMSALLELV
jgi:aminoethylphosphonate catabolism LysR family transcriptional regulator